MMGIMIQTALLVSAILVIRKGMGNKLHVYVRYGLWLLVVARLLLPVNLIDSSLSILRFADTAAMRHMRETDGHGQVTNEYGQGTDNPAEVSAGETASDLAPQQDMTAHSFEKGQPSEEGLWETNDGNHTEYENGAMQTEKNAKKLSVKTIMCTVWIVGSLAVAFCLGTTHIRFRRRLCSLRKVYRGKYVGVMGKKQVPIYLVKNLPSPCLVGFFRPAVYIGKEIDVASDIFRYAVIHEEVHYLHRDYLWALLRVVLVTVYWFHPFVWIAAAASIRDGELACDYGTIQKIGQKERFAYSEMLLKLSSGKKGRSVYSYGTMLRPGKSELKERILCVTDERRSRTWAAALTLLLMAVLAGCAFTGAAQEEGEIQILLTNDAGGDTVKGEETVSNEETTEPQQLEPVWADVTAETPFGADGPTLDFAGSMKSGRESIVIFHDYFGLIVYDLTSRSVVRSLDLAPIGCQMTQGDDACEVAVSADGTTVWLHPRSKRYLYRYEIESNLLWQEPLVKNFQIDLEKEELFDRYLVAEVNAQGQTGWQSNYLYEEYQDEQGSHSASIYLSVQDGEALELGNLQCEWDDMVFELFWDGQDGGFPYAYSGNVNDVEILYDKPCNYSRISDTFGSRINPVTKQTIVHEGIDYAAGQGTDVFAAADGVVYETGFSAKYGNYVVLRHINGEMTYYCHCAEVVAQKDMQVKRGDKIATVGSTGMSTGPHLHFALSRFGEFVDPEKYMQDVIPLEEE